MSRAARSLFLFGIYVFVMSLVTMFVPNILLSSLGLADTTEPWIRVVGVLLFSVSVYYILAAKAELTPLIRWSVWVRPFVFVFFLSFVVLFDAPPVLVMFGIVDVIGALWTYLSLKHADR